MSLCYMSSVAVPNHSARIYSSHLFAIGAQEVLCAVHPSHLSSRRGAHADRMRERCQAQAAASGDLFSLGQNILSAGTQTLERFSRQFQPLPEGFPPGRSSEMPGLCVGQLRVWASSEITRHCFLLRGSE